MSITSQKYVEIAYQSGMDNRKAAHALKAVLHPIYSKRRNF